MKEKPSDMYIAPIPYALADALLAEVFMLHYNRRGNATRRTISSASCVYTVREMMGLKPGRIYLRQAYNDQTYIRLLSEEPEQSSLEMLRLYLSQMNELANRAESEPETILSTKEIKRSESTAESWWKGAAYNDPSPPTPPSTRRLTYLEDRRAVEELRSHPEQREEIHGRWSRAVRRNKERQLSAQSMGATWRRLVSEANKPGS